MDRGRNLIKGFNTYHLHFDIKILRAALEWNFYASLGGVTFWCWYWRGVGRCMWSMQFNVQFCYQLTFLLEWRKPTENRDQVGTFRMQHLNKDPNVGRYLCCWFVLNNFTDIVSHGYFSMSTEQFYITCAESIYTSIYVYTHINEYLGHG
jgi:hypothetical protein